MQQNRPKSTLNQVRNECQENMFFSTMTLQHFIARVLKENRLKYNIWTVHYQHTLNKNYALS